MNPERPTSRVGPMSPVNMTTPSDLVDRVDTLRGAVAPPPQDPADAGTRVLTPSQLTLLAAVQDRLIPREGDLPGAGELGAALRVDGLLAERAEWRPDLLAALKAIDVAALRAWTGRPTGATPAARAERDGAGEAGGFLVLAGDEQDAALREVEATWPLLFHRLLRLTYSAYYTDPRVQRALGVTDEAPQPRGHAMTAFDESRLEPVRARGKLWRDA